MRARDEQGAVAIVTALLLTVMVLLAAFLVDLGTTRADARTDQLLADSSVMAAALTEDDIVGQCVAAVEYFAANLGVSTPADTEDKCDDLPTACTMLPPPGTPPETTPAIAVGDFSLFVTHPVPADDPAMDVQELDPVRDGAACDRIKVAVVKTADYVFGPAGGVGTSGQSVNDAVAVRYQADDPETFGSLIVLEWEACNALVANGSGEVRVVEGAPWDDDGDPATPEVIPEGVITVDSTADGGSGSDECKANRRAIVAPASGCLEADDHIYSYGLLVDATNPHVYDPGSVEPGAGPCDPTGPGGIDGGMAPAPEPGIVIGRRNVDWFYNCLTTYPPSGDAGNQRYPVPEHRGPGRHGPCPDVDSTPPYIDVLHDQLQTDLTGLGFHEVGGGNCPDVEYDGTTLTLDGTTDATAPPNLSRLWMNCNFSNGFSFDAEGLEYVVFQDAAERPDTFRLHGPPDVGAVAYFRNGGVLSSNTGAVVDLQDVFVYIDSRSGDTAVNVNGGELDWFAPVSDAIRATCDPYDTAHQNGDPPPTDLPPAGCFAPLAMWSNSSDDHTLAGNANITVEGSFFAPNAHQFIGGNGVLDFRNSQFFARFLRTTGTGNLDLIANPQTNVPFPPPAPGLIR